MRTKSWNESIEDALITGAIACAATALTAALCGARQSGSAAGPINATSHVVYGREAETVTNVDVKHTVLGFAINAGASVFWALLYEKLFGATADRGRVAQAFFGGKAIADLAYLTDYHLVPKRLTPGWEAHVSERSLLLIFNVLAISLPLRGLLRNWVQRSRLRDSADGLVEPSRAAAKSALRALRG
jgi:hypothetical protein